jgi:hypothetical protein
VRINFIQVLLQQRLLGKDRVFNDQLEQARDVVGIRWCFPQRHQAFQQVPLAVDIPHRTVRCQLGFTDLYGQAAAFCQQRKQFLIQSADLIA